MDVPLIDIIRGQVYAGSWSDHYKQWANRSNTLILRYEDITSNVAHTVARIAGFIGVEPRKQTTHSFSDLQALQPSFFRKGSDQPNIAEIAEIESLASEFRRVHHETMVAAGYA